MEKIDELDMRVVTLEKYSESSNKMTQEIHTALLGTYREKGLISKVEKIEEEQSNCMNRRKTDNNDKKVWKTWIERSVFAGLIGLIFWKIRGLL